MTARRWAIGAAISAGLLLASGARAQGERAREDGRGPAGGEPTEPEAPRKARADAAKAAKAKPQATGEQAATASQAPRAKGGEAAGTPHARKAVPQQRSAQDVRRPVHGRRGGTGAERRTTAGEQVGAASGASAESPVEPPGPRTGGEVDSHAGGGTSSSGDTATGGWSGSSNPDPTQDRR